MILWKKHDLSEQLKTLEGQNGINIWTVRAEGHRSVDERRCP